MCERWDRAESVEWKSELEIWSLRLLSSWRSQKKILTDVVKADPSIQEECHQRHHVPLKVYFSRQVDFAHGVPPVNQRSVLTNQSPVFRSRDFSQPIKGQYF